MAARIFKDEEIKWFYWIVAGLPFLVGLLGLTQQGGLIPSLVMFGGVLIVLTLGWPLTVTVGGSGNITFRGPIRRTVFTPRSLKRVKAMGAQDYRAHIVLRNKFSLIPEGYRCRKYTQSAELAQAVLNLIEKAPDAKVDKDALKLLRQTAKGSTKPLPIKK